jgi:hypothetical protein
VIKTVVRIKIGDSVVHDFPSNTHIGFLIVVAILIALIVIDVSVIRIYDFISKFFIPTTYREIFFVIISVACLAAEFILIEFIRPLRTTQERKTKLHVGIIYLITKLTQYALGAGIIYIVIQVMLGSSYDTINLVTIISGSYLLSIGILGVFIARMLGLLSFRRDMLVLILFVLAIGSITANILITLVNVSLRLLERPSETRVQFGGSMDISKGRFNILDNLYFVSYVISFVTAWIATATLMRHYSYRIGNLKYWLIASVPMIIFAAQFIPSYANILFPSIELDPFFIATMVTIIATLSKPVAGLMLGIGFWTMARVANKNSPIRRYLVFTGFGFFLLFSSNQAILMSIAPYPPFGIVTVTAMGISAYLIVIGLYTSTVSMSQDTELRRYIRRLATSQTRLFDSMVSAESGKEIEKRVLELIKKQSLEMETRTGVETSLDEKEAREYIDEVIREIKK